MYEVEYSVGDIVCATFAADDSAIGAAGVILAVEVVWREHRAWDDGVDADVGCERTGQDPGEMEEGGLGDGVVREGWPRLKRGQVADIDD
jgi:hypothetical protein